MVSSPICRPPSSCTRRASFPSVSIPSSTPSPTRWPTAASYRNGGRALHVRIVEAIETLAGERVAEQVERLAHHALQGEVWDKALVYCRQAGAKAMARWAYREAVGYFEQALRALSHLPETRDTREQAIDLRLALRTALYAVWRRWAHPGAPARGRGPRRGPRRSSSAGTGLALSVTPFLP